MKRLLLTLTVIGLLMAAEQVGARPYPDQVGVCYVFQGDTITKTQSCVISAGYGTGEHYTTLTWPDGSKTEIWENWATDPHPVTLNDEPAESYTRDDVWFAHITEPQQDDSGKVFCTQARGSATSYCYKLGSPSP